MTRARTIADYAKQTTDLATQTELDAAKTALGFQSVPHIVPGVLYPAVHGVLLNSTGLDFVDSGNTGHDIISGVNQRAYHTTSEKKNGNSSIYFTGEANDDFTFADHADFNWGTDADFTYEFFVKAGDQDDTYATVIGDSASKVRVGFGDSATNLKLAVYFQADDVWIQGTSDMSDDTDWHHCAVVRQGTNLRLYVDGVQENSSANKGDASDCGTMRIGSYNGTTKRFKGYVDQIRISNTARYADGTTFTPTTSHFTSDSNTKFLLQSNVSLPHSGAYGTAQSDGRMYYYTDIKGSKPIKDPRIGAHFGSQRYKNSSLQTLEQETATQGNNVFSIDGREWMRAVGSGFETVYDSSGQRVRWNSTANTGNDFIEITGYFNAINGGFYASANRKNLKIVIDGTQNIADFSGYESSVSTPLASRYVDASSSVNIPITGVSLGIHTIRMTVIGTDQYCHFYNFELIAQDTTSDANKSKIQIPSQNVVSYGKKFTVSGTPHYDPFNGFTSGTDISGYIDEATSLGMSNWKVSSTWYRPFNGGRVVKWVDSSGNIKTSVTMMPPNAQNIGGTASNAIDLSSSQTNDDTINFNTSAIDHSLSEVAKSFHWREFGNGSANGNATYADFSMLATSADDVAYVMDDGLTSFSADDTLIDSTANADFLIQNGKAGYITFIGTGISFRDVGTAEAGIPDGTYSINLPYGTHIFKYLREDLNQDEIYLDGIKIKDPAGTTGGYFGSKDITFHQPKKPPIPEDAVVLADYMLMADFVPIASAGIQNISKGVRSISCSRDMFWDETDDATVALNISVGASASGFDMTWSNAADSAGTETVKLPTFSTNTVMRGYGGTDRFTLIGPATEAGAGSSADATGQYIKYTNNYTLGTNVVGASVKASKWLSVFNMEVVTPIHTSSHYQPFETPFLHELVGGDRNMEQTNLVVTPDGKTWDEVTRDTSYIGNICVVVSTEEIDANHDWMFKYWNDWRGRHGSVIFDAFNKNFAIAYDRLICLVGGHYHFYMQYLNTQDISGSEWAQIRINNERLVQTYQQDGDSNPNMVNCGATGFLQRGDYVQIYGATRSNEYEINRFEIIKLEK